MIQIVRADGAAERAVMEAMKNMLYIPFSFENEGTQIIHDEWESFELEPDQDQEKTV